MSANTKVVPSKSIRFIFFGRSTCEPCHYKRTQPHHGPSDGMPSKYREHIAHVCVRFASKTVHRPLYTHSVIVVLVVAVHLSFVFNIRTLIQIAFRSIGQSPASSLFFFGVCSSEEGIEFCAYMQKHAYFVSPKQKFVL